MFEVHAVETEGKWVKLDVGSRVYANRIAEQIKKGVDYICELKPKKSKRSNDANAYFWAMCGKLAAKLRIPKVEIYREYIKEIGDNFFISPIENDKADKVCKAWNEKGLGWVTDNLGNSKISGYKNICFYFGSSTYDTEQMSRLIDLCIQDCKEQDIDVLNDRERSLMLENWDAKTNKSDIN